VTNGQPLELFSRIITVSLETMKVVRSLPKLELPRLRDERDGSVVPE
jgi:hypothetical protein